MIDILKHVPHCTMLNLRANPLSELDIDSLDQPLAVFNGLSNLVLNATAISWPTLCAALRLFPRYCFLKVEPVQLIVAVVCMTMV